MYTVPDGEWRKVSQTQPARLSTLVLFVHKNLHTEALAMSWHMFFLILFSEYRAKGISCAAVVELYGDCHLSSKPLAPCNHPRVAVFFLNMEINQQEDSGESGRWWMTRRPIGTKCRCKKILLALNFIYEYMCVSQVKSIILANCKCFWGEFRSLISQLSTDLFPSKSLVLPVKLSTTNSDWS